MNEPEQGSRVFFANETAKWSFELNYPIKVDVPVAWGEMDAFGHVNNVVFFRYFESLRIAYFRALSDNEIKSDEFVPILAQTECQYLRPVYFPDTLKGEAAISRVGKTSLTMEYRLSSAEHGEIVAQGKAVVVNVDSDSGKSRPLSEAMKQRITQLQS